jgi:hypothetical protein
MEYRTFLSIVHRQLVAAFETLEQTVSIADDKLWQEAHTDGSVDQVVFHTLFYADLYMNPSPDGFRDQAFHRAHQEFFQDYQEERDEEPTNHYARETCLDYLRFCKEKAALATDTETEESLAGDSGFSWYPCSRAEMYLINVRHIQHHGAQLGLRRQLAGYDPLRWKSGLNRRG